jgi:predicted kinase
VTAEVRPPLVLVSGMPGAGKSTLAARLGERLHLPVVAKDPIKEALTRVAGLPSSLAESRSIGARGMDALWAIAGAHLDVGVGVVLESNFKTGLSAQYLAPLVERSRAVDVHCAIAGGLAIERYRSRAGSRHGAHIEHAVLGEASPEGWEAEHAAVDLHGVPVLMVDTTDGYSPSLDAIIEWVEERISC